MGGVVPEGRSSLTLANVQYEVGCATVADG